MALGLRLQKKQATRTALSLAALQLAVEKGPEAVTVEDIAARANVSPRTFFNHFSTKDEAYVADDLDRAEQLLERFRARPEGAPVWSSLTALVAELLAEAPEDPAEARALHVVRTSPSVLTQQYRQYADLEAELLTEVRRRMPADPSGLQARLLTASIVAALRAATDTWLEGGDATPVALFERATALLSPLFAPGALDPVKDVL